ncbi:MAG: tRNA 2-thiouridine(34) synthase MnmA [Natronospirillum sp.]|uniref:tRNA 2-thiouridine(34) synthase MnmA n=1 Tax=Natronospirillum sp. TaxID=2812955 RepID=UPI0025CE0D84|nr:tRNA 2-thiouridine(34) synthase MnmA [Natronospirillum sp.]MCH8551054.1 tRNA 2-thiouridine(34) synthase MnmA [Natronospirillum sp.]
MPDPRPHPDDTRVIVGMSGGVDSSVSALLLQRQGYQVEGLFMKNWEEDDGTEYCTAKEDLADAQSVCDRLGITLHSANFAAEYWDNVFEHFLAEYKAGRTPNPDILCNREIKFKAFLDYARVLGADMIATGHYVQRGADQSGRACLRKGLDRNKDQSYFLHQVGHEQLALTFFPVGELDKPVVRQLAEEEGLVTHDKKDSTGICFIGERRFSDFLKQYLPAQPGLIKTPEGDVIGEHAGLMYYTIGQRQGLGIGGLKNYPEAPWFAADKDLDNNVLIAVQGIDHPLLYTRQARVSDLFWISGEEPDLTLPMTCKHRYRQADQPCRLVPTETGYTIEFAEPQRAVTPGQSAVIYHGDVCLGGGVIEEAWR